MNNIDVKKVLDDCLAELENITALLIGLGDGANPTPYIKKYAVIRATGSIEAAFKQIKRWLRLIGQYFPFLKWKPCG